MKDLTDPGEYEIQPPQSKPLKLNKMVEQDVIESEHGRSEKPFNVFSPSQVGYCKRQMYNRKMNLTKMDRYVKGILHSGTVNHFWLEHHLPHMVEDRALDTEVKFREELKTDGDVDFNLFVSGYADAIDSEGIVYDHKFTGDTKYVKQGPKEKDKRQVLMYLFCLDNVKAGQLEYVTRDGKFGAGEYLEHVIVWDYEAFEDSIENMKQVAEKVKERVHTQKMYANPFEHCSRDSGDACFFCQNEDWRGEVYKKQKELKEEGKFDDPEYDEG